MSIYFVKSSNNSVYAVRDGKMFLLKDPNLSADVATDRFTLEYMATNGVKISTDFTLDELDTASCVPILTNSTTEGLFGEMIDNLLLQDATGVGVSTFTDATRPSSPVVGKWYFNTSSGLFEYFDGSDWQTMDATATTVLAAPASITPTGGDEEISVAFDLSSGATNYVAQASDDDFANIAASNSGGSSPVVITGLTNGTAYKTRVRAEAVGAVTSGYRTSASTTTPSA